jgi:hypothetical protein
MPRSPIFTVGHVPRVLAMAESLQVFCPPHPTRASSTRPCFPVAAAPNTIQCSPSNLDGSVERGTLGRSELERSGGDAEREADGALGHPFHGRVLREHNDRRERRVAPTIAASRPRQTCTCCTASASAERRAAAADARPLARPWSSSSRRTSHADPCAFPGADADIGRRPSQADDQARRGPELAEGAGAQSA